MLLQPELVIEFGSITATPAETRLAGRLSARWHVDRDSAERPRLVCRWIALELPRTGDPLWHQMTLEGLDRAVA
jgi:hypothetical protein